LIAWWTGDEDASDISGSGYHGVLLNGVIIDSGKVDQAFTLDGVDDHILVPPSNELNISGDVTVDLWAKRGAVGASNAQVLLKKGALEVGTVDAPASYLLEIYPGDTISAGFERADGSNVLLHGPPITDLSYHHYAYVRHGSIHELYLDGALVASDSFDGEPGSTADIDLLIGAHRHQGGAVHYFYGQIDEVEIFSRALLPSEVVSIYEAGSNGKCKPINITCNCSNPGFFDPPMDRNVTVKKRNRVLPIKFTLCDEDGVAVTDMDISAPIAEVDYTGPGVDTIYDTDDFLTAGHGDDGNQFLFHDGDWRLNLRTKMFEGPGIYTIRAQVSGCGEILRQ